MPDVEYSLERRPNTRRLAVLGDSVTRGQGAPFGESFEALTEQYLNEHHTSDGIQAYELLNFSNTGYRLTQIVDVALEKAPAFAPDVYIVCLSRLSVSRKWGDHVAQLVYAGVDLKYPYLKSLVTSAGLDSRDAPGTMDAKLAPYRLEAIRWAIETIREKARADGAEVVVLLVPTATAPDDLERAFEGVDGVLRELGVPTISLLDTFADVDLTPFMVDEGNIHPNRAGHQRIFEHLKSRLDAGDEAARILLGSQE
jgi:lysophospholipase L1-like esterase